MIEDVATEDKPLIGAELGEYNRKFASKWGKYLKDRKVTELSITDLVKELDKIYQKVSMSALGTGREKLSLFSEWLNNLDNNDFYNPEVYIEIPGQYEGNHNSEPIPGKNVKIASIRAALTTMASNRRPKCLTVHGSNEKDYLLLIKGGEDLRLDQRVQ
jgi:DNA-dependent protein kinase catalytic subunit